MRETVQLFRSERRARVFFAALTQSALGTGAGYVALLVIAYDRFHSPWAISLILIADLVPAMLLGPVFGAAADRWSRRRCLVVADLLRAVAFGGIALVDGFGPTLALAVLAGAGTGMFAPAAQAALPGLVRQRMLPAASALYGAIADLGFTVGPLIAAVFLLLGGPEWILAVNAVTFLLSALVLARLRFGEAPSLGLESERSPARVPSLLRDAREGLRVTAGMSGIRVILLASGFALFVGGLFNVAELLLATGPLGAGQSGYSVLVAAFGLGFVAGSLAGSRGGEPAELKRRYLLGILLMGFGVLASGLATVYEIALVTFAVGGFGNGMLLVYERLLVQSTVADAVMGRVFGVKDAITAWAFGAAFLAGGGLIALVGTRELVVVAGAGVLIVWVGAAFALRSSFARAPAVRAPAVGLGGAARAPRHGRARQHGADLVDGSEHWLTLLDDLREGRDDARIELSPGVRG